MVVVPLPGRRTRPTCCPAGPLARGGRLVGRRDQRVRHRRRPGPVPGVPRRGAGRARGGCGPGRSRGGRVTRLTTDDGAYSGLCPSPDGRSVYALRSALDSPPAVVRIDAARPGRAGAAARPGRRPGAARPADRDRGRGGRRHAGPRLAGATGHGQPPAARAAAAVGARRPVFELEFLVLAVEPVADGGPRATPCCCLTRGCPPGTGRSSSPGATAPGVTCPSPT